MSLASRWVMMPFLMSKSRIASELCPNEVLAAANTTPAITALIFIRLSFSCSEKLGSVCDDTRAGMLQLCGNLPAYLVCDVEILPTALVNAYWALLNSATVAA